MNTLGFQNREARSDKILALINELDYMERRDLMGRILSSHGAMIVALLGEYPDKLRDAHPQIQDQIIKIIAATVELQPRNFNGYYRPGAEG